MSERITIRHVRAMVGRAVNAARAVGIDTSHWWLQTGSSPNGIAYRLFAGTAESPTVGGTAVHGLDIGYLGMTAREAYHTLHTLAAAWEEVEHQRREQGQ